MANKDRAKRSYVLVPEGDNLKPDDLREAGSMPAEGSAAARNSAAVQDVQGQAPPQPGDAADESAAANPLAPFSLLYESKDGRLCTFEDAQGHLTSVDSQHML